MYQQRDDVSMLLIGIARSPEKTFDYQSHVHRLTE
jgi:hypothetical protein